MGPNEFQESIIERTLVKLPDGGDSHIHPYGQNETDFVITTRIPIGGGQGSAEIHDNPAKSSSDFGWKP